MKNIVIVMLMLIILSSCSQKKEEKNTELPIEENKIEGSWKLVYADILENDSLQIKDLGNTDFIKIINRTHFAFFNQDRETSENFMAGGGSYTFDGRSYKETLNFIASPDYRGHVFPFEVEIKGDSLIQKGHEKIEEAGLDRYIVEKYIRIK